MAKICEVGDCSKAGLTEMLVSCCCFFKKKNAVFEEDENAVQNLGQQAKMKDSVLHWGVILEHSDGPEEKMKRHANLS